MGDPSFYCPLCCDMKFLSKQALTDHLSKISSNIKCPICSKKYSTLGHIIKHLRVDNCVATCKDQTAIFQEKTSIPDNNNKISSPRVNQTSDDDNSQNETYASQPLAHSPVTNAVTEAYVDILHKQLVKQNFQGQELKFIKEEAEGQYLIMTDGTLLNAGGTVVTKQNHDGTISLNDTNEPETEFVTIENDDIESKEEIYSCNTCGVSFTSVSEHIQNYHNDQLVVVEGNDENNISEVSIELQPMQCDEPITDRQMSRRMITDTGDIVEAPIEEEDSEAGLTSTRNIVLINDELNMKGEQYEVQIDKYNDNVKAKKTIEAKGPFYHRAVVLKEMQTEAGERIKVYNCKSCHLYVTSLSQFQNRPCKKNVNYTLSPNKPSNKNINYTLAPNQSPKKADYWCPHCPIAYKNSKSLSAHMKVHKIAKKNPPELPDDMKFVCDVCSTVFPTSKSFKLHKRMHDPIKSRPIEAPVELPYGSIPSEDKYLCTVCDKLIPVDYRSVHQASHQRTALICDVCNKKFESREYLDMHMTVHNMDKVTVGKQDKSLPYNCLYCARKFARPHEKVKHERIHTGEKPHSCEICGKAFRVSYCLTLHMRTHTGARPYACPHCNKRFKAHSVFNHHLLTHSEVRAYKCPYCPKAFKTSVQLAGHRNSHTKPFACQQCNRPFASLYAVRVHMESHQRHNSLKFACSLCGASYARAFALNDHVRTAHRSEDIATADVDDKANEWNAEESIEEKSEDLRINKIPGDVSEIILTR